jgi:hypothetical protein
MDPAAADPFYPANDPIGRAKSNDPDWKYALWPDLEMKDLLQCKLCGQSLCWNGKAEAAAS